MTSKNKLKYLFILGVLIAAGFALADSLGFFNPKPYTAVNHGSHNHYVPENRNPDVGINQFPMEEPGPAEMITPTGQIVKESGWKPQQQKAQFEQSEDENAETDSNTIRTVEILGTDQMKFMVDEESERINTGRPMQTSSGQSYLILDQIKANPGERLRIRLTTVSQHKPDMMAHNWVLLEQDADAQDFVNVSNRENDYLPSEREEGIIAYTEMAAGGETVEVTFTAPEEQGRYEYLCSFMAHFAAGMRGELIVQS